MTATHTSTEELRQRATAESRRVVDAVDATFDALEALASHLAAAPAGHSSDAVEAAAQVIAHGEQTAELLEVLRQRALVAAEYKGKRTIAENLATRQRLLFPPPARTGPPSPSEEPSSPQSDDDVNYDG